MPLFNPLQQHIVKRNTGGANTDNHNEINWDSKAKQLYNAIMWIIVIWDGVKLDSPLYNIKEVVEENARYEPFPSLIKGVNTIK